MEYDKLIRFLGLLSGVAVLAYEFGKNHERERNSFCREQADLRTLLYDCRQHLDELKRKVEFPVSEASDGAAR